MESGVPHGCVSDVSDSNNHGYYDYRCLWLLAHPSSPRLWMKTHVSLTRHGNDTEPDAIHAVTHHLPSP